MHIFIYKVAINFYLFILSNVEQEGFMQTVLNSHRINDLVFEKVIQFSIVYGAMSLQDV